MLGRRAIGIEMMRERRQAAKTRVEEGDPETSDMRFLERGVNLPVHASVKIGHPEMQHFCYILISKWT